MADEAYPVKIADLDGDSEAVHRQLVSVTRFHQQRTREFAAWACRIVGGWYCRCDGPPPLLADFSSRDERREAARGHPGTCGVAQADVIAGVETETVEQAAAGRHQEATYRTFRNQACYDAARALNVRGAGVQVRRNTCFEKACQALWPGTAAINEHVAAGFSSDNVLPFSDAEEGEGDGVAEEEA
eukprot:g14338.t1